MDPRADRDRGGDCGDVGYRTIAVSPVPVIIRLDRNDIAAGIAAGHADGIAQCEPPMETGTPTP